MKNLWAAVGIAVGAFCLLGLILYGLALNAGTKVSQDARAYVKQTAPVFLASDKGDEFLKVAAPQLKANTPQADANKMFGLVRKQLGKFQGLQKVVIGATRLGPLGGGKEGVFVSFTIEADYDKGPATFDAVVVRDADKWQYAKLNLTTDLRD